MMKYYKVEYPCKYGDGLKIYTEKDIIDEYWSYWQSRGKRCNAEPHELTHERCIDDFIVVNWAVACDKEGVPLK